MYRTLHSKQQQKIELDEKTVESRLFTYRAITKDLTRTRSAKIGFDCIFTLVSNYFASVKDHQPILEKYKTHPNNPGKDSTKSSDYRSWWKEPNWVSMICRYDQCTSNNTIREISPRTLPRRYTFVLCNVSRNTVLAGRASRFSSSHCSSIQNKFRYTISHFDSTPYKFLGNVQH